MYSDGLLKLPIFTIQKNFKILLTVYSLSPRILQNVRHRKYCIYPISDVGIHYRTFPVTGEPHMTKVTCFQTL